MIEKELSESKEELVNISMKMILHAGEARTLMMQVYDLLEEEKFEEAKEKLKMTHDQIDISHTYQTGVVQKEANGELIEYSPLFTHAQDILMTVQAQYVLTTRIARLFKKLAEKGE